MNIRHRHHAVLFQLRFFSFSYSYFGTKCSQCVKAITGQNYKKKPCDIMHIVDHYLWLPCVADADIIFLPSIPPRLNSYSLDSKKQLDKVHNSLLNTTHSARNLGFISDEHLAFSDQISAISKACCYHIRHVRCIRPYLDSTTASTIATSIVHSKLDYCNSLYYNLPKS